MALRIPEKRTETIEVASYLDGAIDYEATGPDVLTLYASCDDLDVGKLSLKKGEKLSLFTIQSLGEDQMALVQSDLSVNSALGLQTAARLSILDFSGEEWRPRFGMHHGNRAINKTSFGQIDRETQMFIGAAAMSISSLGK